MIRRATTLISVLWLLSLSSYSQTSKSIVSGRPGQAIAPVCVGKNVFQIETGFDFTGTSSPSGVYMAPGQEFLNQSQSYLNATLLRFGLGERVEMHSGWEFRNDDYSLVDTLGAAQNSSVGGISFSSVGWRFTILEGEGLKPSVAYQFSMKLNILTEAYKLSQVAPNMNVAPLIWVLIGMEKIRGKRRSIFLMLAIHWVISLGFSLRITDPLERNCWILSTTVVLHS